MRCRAGKKSVLSGKGARGRQDGCSRAFGIQRAAQEGRRHAANGGNMVTRRNGLEEMVAQAVRPGEHVLAAVSGGADSTALVLLLVAARDRGIIRLSAAHFEHGIRGEESLADMRFVQELCAQRQIELLCGVGDVPAEARRRKRGMEETAREMRRAFLQQARAQTGADVIALAHHADDQAETVLMRLFRGSAPAGTCGMRERQGEWIRPLLHCRKRRLIDYLSQEGVSWREDSTNAQECTPRNSLRLRAMPEIEKVWPGAVEAIVRYADIQAQESDFLQAEAARWLEQSAMRGPGGMKVQTQCLPDRAVLARAMKILAGKDALQTDIERLCALCGAQRGRAELRGGTFADVQAAPGEIWFLYPQEGCQAPLAAPGETPLGKWGIMQACPGTGQPVCGDPWTQELDAQLCGGAVLRLWREGDRIRPLGMGGKSRLLSDIYAERGVSAPARRMQPVLEKNGEILWAVGQCIAHAARLTGKNRALRLHWSGAQEIPWKNIWDEKQGGTEE